MILTVTPNPAVDITYRVRDWAPGRNNRVQQVTARAGGKGVNVARVLRALGVDVTTTGLLGGPDGAMLATDLAEQGLRPTFLDISGHTRRTVAIVADDREEATLFHEPGPPVAAEEWGALVALVAGLVEGVAVLVCSGSLPPGVPAHGHAQLLALGKEHGVPTIVDTSGPALRAAVDAGGAILKPNRDELAELGYGPSAALSALLDAGARAVVASHGPGGLVAVTPEGAWRAMPVIPVRGNPTGAGDAVVAALAAGLARGIPWPAITRHAAAVGAAAVAAPLAGEIDSHALDRVDIRLEEANGPCSSR